jgi:hypothetical protein
MLPGRISMYKRVRFGVLSFFYAPLSVAAHVKFIAYCFLPTMLMAEGNTGSMSGKRERV